MIIPPKNLIRLIIIICILFHQNEVASQTKFTKLVWAEEFNYKGLPDSSKWNFAIVGHGWGNNELQSYTDKDTLNAKVENGFLKIIAIKQPKENRQYTSARLHTKNNAEFKYCRIEARAKLPASVGTWPAIWMLGNNISKVHWPACG
ncbi:MAG: glycoside hydrolase family 16 protein, partial [Chitinophagaceae bacterium]